MCEVAYSQSVTSPSLHSFVISYIAVTNCGKTLSIGVDEFIVSLDPTVATPLLEECEDDTHTPEMGTWESSRTFETS
jgi:hypothetical protein